MLERFTVDVLAEHIATQLLEGEPTPKLAHRFFRKGRRDGKRALEHTSVSKLLQDAVHLAGSTLAEDFTAERKKLRDELTVQEALVLAYASRTEGDDGEPSAATPTPAAVESAPSGAVVAAGDGHHKDSAQVLIDALGTRRELQARRIREAAEQAAADREAARRASLDAASAAATAAKGEIPRLEKLLRDLPDEYVQRFESITHSGEILWSRYCNGFVLGESRRGSRSSDVETPDGPLHLVPPKALTAVPAAPASGDAANPSATDHATTDGL